MTDWGIHFAQPGWGLLLWAWAGVVIALALLERRGSDVLDRLVSLDLQARLVDRPSPWRRWARIGLLAIAGGAMIVALMQPQWGLRYVSTPRVGAEIMIALDVSRSMFADDAKPSRLERAKAEISDLLAYLGDDHVGLIVFAGRASVLSPMTPDKSFLRLALENAGPHSVSRGGTRLAEPILRAVAGMGEPGPAQRALILITDGEDHDSFVLDAAKAAAEAGIKIIAIGFGDESGSPVYLRDPKTGARTLLRDSDGQAVVSRLDGELLREIALATDGAYVPAGTGVLDLASIYEAHIARLTRGQLDERGRTIRDELYQAFVMLALACLIAAVSVASGRRHAGLRQRDAVALGAMALVLLPLLSAPTAHAQSSESDAEAEVASSAPAPEATPPGEDPREVFNRANAQLAAGDAVAASALYRDARRDATDDVGLRYAATYNLGIAAAARAESLRSENRAESLAALYEAADWFREASAARPDDEDPRHNLEVTLRLALVLADEIAREGEGELDAELDALIGAQRERVMGAARLLEEVALAGELDGAETLRPAFRDAATEQRVILSDANTLADRIAGERERLARVEPEQRTPEDALRQAQIEAVLVHLDSAIERMGQTRRQLRQRRAERAYRRGSSALSDLKRARDQLRSPVEQIGVLLAERERLASSTLALASQRVSALSGAPAPDLPAFLTQEAVGEESAQLEARVNELASRLEQAAGQAGEDGQAGRAATTPEAVDPEAADRAMLAQALTEAAPLVARAGEALGRATGALGSGQLTDAMRDEGEAGEALAEARERFFDLRQLLDATHADQSTLAAISGSEEEAIASQRDEYGEYAASLQARNIERSGRLAALLDHERDKRLAELEASEAAASDDPEADPVERERQRFEMATQLLALASGAMLEAKDALGPQADEGEGPPRLDWPAVEEAATRASERLDQIRTLFFTLAEHVRKLALDQVDLRDRTQDAIALSAVDSPAPPPTPATAPSAQGSSSPRGSETQARVAELEQVQGGLEARGGELADALFVQAEEVQADGGGGVPPEAAAGAGPDGEQTRDRIRRAAEHVAAAQLAMRDAVAVFSGPEEPLPPAHEAQGVAIEELAQALALLSPPPQQNPPQDQQQDQDQQDQGEGEDPPEPGDEGEPQPQPGQGQTPEDAQDEEMGDPSRLLQGVRDREAERRRDRERDQQQRRSEPVEKDW